MSSSPLNKIFSDRTAGFKQVVFKQETKDNLRERFGKFANVASLSLVGIEVEIEDCAGVVSDKWTDSDGKIFHILWSTTEDGSLRNRGLEFVSKPIVGRNVGIALTLLKGALDTCYPNSRSSARCGIHVHINAMDTNVAQLFAWVSLYMLFERGLYKFSGGREKNIFCLPTWAWKGNILAAIPKLARGSEVHAASALYQNGLKYAGMNTIPLGEKGTLEFRQMKTTKDFKQVSAWISLLCSIKDFACENVKTLEDLEKFWTSIAALNTTSEYDVVLGSVFDKYSNILSYEGYSKDMAQGVIAIKELQAAYLAIKLAPKPKLEDLLGDYEALRISRDQLLAAIQRHREN